MYNLNNVTKLTMRSKVRTLALKIYLEQMPNGWDGSNGTKERIQSIPKTQMQIIAIKHYKDYLSNDIFEPSIAKPHYHIIIRILNNKSMYIKSLLDLLGIVFRPPYDVSLWNNHGVATVGDYSKYALYLTHETEEAILAGKITYKTDEYVSNLTTEEINQIRDGSVRVTEIKKVTLNDMAALDAQAYALGYDLGDFNKWVNTLSFSLRYHPGFRTCKSSYERGLNDRFENGDKRVNRICVFIQGEHNTGKTYAAEEALKSMGKNVLTVKGGKTGKFDELRPSTDAIILDDETMSDILGMADNYICRAYKRQNNNPLWCGEYLIVTYNKSFREWVEDCKITTQKWNDRGLGYFEDTKQYEAIKSRFYICEVGIGEDGKNQLFCTSPSKRGTKDEQIERKEKYKVLRDIINQSLASYEPNEDLVDYDDINGTPLFS